LAGNRLCGLEYNGRGTYTSWGITKLCEALKGSAVTSLKCDAAPVSASLSVPIDTATPHLCSLANNQLCGLDRQGNGTYTSEGITKLCEALKGSSVTSLKCAAAPECSLSCQRPLTHANLSPFPTLPLAHSLEYNQIGAKGATALAAILKETQITNLGCAAA